MRQWYKLSGFLMSLFAILLMGMVGASSAAENNRMLLTGNGHGILFDGKAREAAGVPKEIDD